MSAIISSVKSAKDVSRILATVSTATKNEALEAMAETLDSHRMEILDANSKDMASAKAMLADGKITEQMVKRLKVDDDKISGMIDGIKDVIKLDDPVGKTISALELDDGLNLYQISCPIGMLGVIFESRPDVVPQIMSLCLKSGNSVAFKGGSEAAETIKVLFDLLTEAVGRNGIPAEAFVLMQSREDISAILGLDEYIDLLIPRGSNDFVKYIQNNTKIPVLGHAAGICHMYVDSEADLDLAVATALDAKIQYPAVCNALETLLVNRSVAGSFLPRMMKAYSENGVEMRVDGEIRNMFPYVETKPATDEDWDTEYGDLIIAIKLVEDAEEAIAFINLHGSHHTDAIITENKMKQARFVSAVDSADVFINASTRFADGFRYGKGAEVGISTNKIHSRGPVGMEGLMIYKYVLVGNGQVVKDYVGHDAKKFTHIPKNESLRF